MGDDNVYTNDDNELSYNLPPMTATLHFDLESVEGERRLRECLDASRFKSALYQLDDWLRGLVKYQDMENIEIQEVRDRILFVCEGFDINIWED